MSVKNPADWNKYGHQLSPTAGVATSGTGAAIDCKGFEYIDFIAITGTADASADFELRVQDSDDGSTGWAQVTGYTAAIGASDDDTTKRVTLRCDVAKRYMRANWVRTAGTVDLAIGYSLSGPSRSADDLA